ncbi:hypothetical protein [Roseomonas rosulenta]|uniref:hypothetical protein n=1 Tax=Roseomonas rosulenta TaxID=2748667 RepID=UPI0018DF10C2|nr:hypothetical protein [Roseomonas rosulenta]
MLTRVPLGKGELRGAVDGREALELALPGPDLGNIDLELADRAGLDAIAGEVVAIGFGKARDPAALGGSDETPSASDAAWRAAGRRAGCRAGGCGGGR